MTLQEPIGTQTIRIQNSDHLIFEQDSDRKKLLIVFAYINQKLGTRSHSSFLRNVDCKKLFLNPGLNDWYQTGVPGVASSYSGLLAFLQNVKSSFVDHEILCLGHSMGGFPALGIGVSIGADRILASAPEFILNTPDSLSIRHLEGKLIECGDLTPVLSSNSKSMITVVVGNQNAFDMRVARRLGEFPHTRTIELETGHNTFPYLRDVGKLGAVLEAFVEGEAIRPVVEGI
ncbi:hypothetical protein HPT29_004490 [Microvirga terrae]|uniref:Alpha/beta hydrolase n=1 Tax=Microvirga terrae TaxID=2740529 RepID=A0ABY5RU19_9HYPH|nr:MULTISPECIES: hypothetical protein [Microvirga]MBQ0824644.1 hypothetical protein [Microvirga sp. HBU67558]UVF20414.1 hypothetical protein HPT29_004490 [Microvirga terrae]